MAAFEGIIIRWICINLPSDVTWFKLLSRDMLFFCDVKKMYFILVCLEVYSHVVLSFKDHIFFKKQQVKDPSFTNIKE